MADSPPVIELRHVGTRFGSHVVHTDIDLAVQRAEVFALIGGSGSGKSTLLREMVLLHQPDSGSVHVLGNDLATLDAEAAQALRQRWGVMFQHGGLFGALTVKENIGLPLREHTGLSGALIDEIADWKLAMTGLAPEVGAQYPPELSGGMMKRASLARALALDPELLFLDEPTAGLDPVSAAGVDTLVRELRTLFGLTIVMITHDLDLLWQVADRVAVLADGRVVAIGSMAELSHHEAPAVRAFFDGPRGRTAQQQAQQPAVQPAVQPAEPSARQATQAAQAAPPAAQAAPPAPPTGEPPSKPR
ncbi:ABC transporter ATP-binding protein [Ideonella sp. A 288]|uniref:ABC transporter ATP-binding protein n=1 Tax=Ideonella sp. A 288 TaxID=1962181 RepID=UPI000B4AF5C0|nr:ATP-binding cassette domain-containing protein [Ideonella sp. A 288]